MATYWVTRSSQRAYCEECGTNIGSESNGLAVAARHSTATGHRVSVEVERVVIYDRPERIRKDCLRGG